MPSDSVNPGILSAALANRPPFAFLDGMHARSTGRPHHAALRHAPDHKAAAWARHLHGAGTEANGANSCLGAITFHSRYNTPRHARESTNHRGHGLHHSPATDAAYSTIEAAGVIVTGIRTDGVDPDSVVVTGSAVSAGVTTAALYEGPLSAVTTASSGSWHLHTPVFAGQTVTSSTFYGPNTALFNPSLGAGNIRAVGSYKYDEGASGANADHGMMYQGPVSGAGGTWTQLDATSLVTSGTLINTIAHSTMGNLVVGNYDTDLATGHAFIYDVTAAPASAWTELNPTGAASATAYGIWQNGGSASTSYTIAGGFSDLSSGGLDEGYLVDYDSATKQLTHLTTFNFDNKPITSLVSHFDGITATATGYNLTGDYIDLDHGAQEGGFFASVTRLPDGSFSKADWTAIAFASPSTPDVLATSGNTVLGNHVLGIYVADDGGDHTVSSYVATVSSTGCYGV
jgi:hypothetical protein